MRPTKVRAHITNVRWRCLASANNRLVVAWRAVPTVLSDPGKRTIYDLYGLDGLRAGYEVGPRLKTPAEVRKQH